MINAAAPLIQIPGLGDSLPISPRSGLFLPIFFLGKIESPLSSISSLLTSSQGCFNFFQWEFKLPINFNTVFILFWISLHANTQTALFHYARLAFHIFDK